MLYTTVLVLVVIIKKEVNVKLCGRAAGYLVWYSDTGSVLVQSRMQNIMGGVLSKHSQA